MVFPVVMYGCESWTVKKAKCWRIDAFELWYWRRLLRVPWTSNQLILKESSREYSLEGLMLKLKLQYFGHLIGRTDSLEKTLILGKTEGGRWRGWQRMRWLNGITDLMGLSLSKLREFVLDREAWRAAVHVVTKRHNWVNNSNNFNLKIQILCDHPLLALYPANNLYSLDKLVPCSFSSVLCLRTVTTSLRRSLGPSCTLA